jgi:hypothetical protein
LKIDKSAEAKRISSQIVESVIDGTVYHGKNFAPDIVNEIVNNVTRDVDSNNNELEVTKSLNCLTPFVSYPQLQYLCWTQWQHHMSSLIEFFY